VQKSKIEIGVDELSLLNVFAETETTKNEEPLLMLVEELRHLGLIVLSSSDANFSDYLYKQRIVEIATELEKRINR
jgi:hypothetical protein